MTPSSKSYIIAVDSGGTFADCVVIDNDGIITTSKAHSTPRDFSIGVIDSVESAAGILELTVQDILSQTRYFFAHGSTVAVNALLTRSGSKTALITTKGFEDTLIMGRVEQKVAGLSEVERFQVYRLNKADPIIPRPLIKGVSDRMDCGGHVVVPLNTKEVKQRVTELVAEGVESIAVCLLWSFMNPSHEQAIKKMINEMYPHVFVSMSSDLIPVIKDYQRTATTAINAYLSPIMVRYLRSLHNKLKDKG